MLRVLSLSAAGSLLLAGLALACLHPPRDYQATVEATGQEALLFWNDGREELVLKADYKVDSEKPLPSLAWVMPVPSLPDSYGVTSPKVFEEAFKLADSLKPATKGPPRPPAGSVVVAQEVTVGEYNIKALDTFGPDAAKALNDWLTENGFSVYPATQLKFYTDRKWGFLAIKINTAEADKSLKAEGALRPLRIGFASEKPVYPLKFQSAKQNMPVTVYAFTPRKATPTGFLEEHGVAAVKIVPGDSISESVEATKGIEDAEKYPELAKLYGEISKGKLGKPAKLFLTKVTGKVNRDVDLLADWTKDFELKVSDK